MAQLVAHLSCKQAVVGSSPTVSSLPAGARGPSRQEQPFFVEQRLDRTCWLRLLALACFAMTGEPPDGPIQRPGRTRTTVEFGTEVLTQSEVERRVADADAHEAEVALRIVPVLRVLGDFPHRKVLVGNVTIVLGGQHDAAMQWSIASLWVEQRTLGSLQWTDTTNHTDVQASVTAVLDSLEHRQPEQTQGLDNQYLAASMAKTALQGDPKLRPPTSSGPVRAGARPRGDKCRRVLLRRSHRGRLVVAAAARHVRPGQ